MQPSEQPYQQSEPPGPTGGEPSAGSVAINQLHSDKLNMRLDEGQASLEKLTKSNASLKTDLDAAQKWENDVEQAVIDYGKAEPVRKTHAAHFTEAQNLHIRTD